MATLDIRENLEERLRVIEKLPVAIGQRIYMALVCLGEVPAWEIHITEDSCVSDTLRKAKALNSMLVDAGFETVIGEERPIRTNHSVVTRAVYYSDSIEKANELAAILDRGGHTAPSGGRAFSLEEDAALGRLYGFPETAIDAYVDDVDENGLNNSNRPNSVWWGQLPDAVKSADYAKLLRFMPSKANIDQELEVVKRWARVLEEKVPGLWREYLRG